MNDALNIAIAGLGTVGCATVNLLQRQADLLARRTGRAIRVSAVNARNKKKERGLNLDGIAWVDDTVSLASRDDVDVVIELIGGSDGVAKALVEAALQKGKHVVTANKALIAHHGTQLAALAEKNEAGLLFEAAVAGGIPIIDAMQHGAASNAFVSVTGILNGTGNYILTTMDKTGRDFADVLKEAQELGYAEADPSFDVDGIDTAHKLAILTTLAFGTPVNLDAVHIEGIRSITRDDMQYAKELGYTVKLFGIAQHTRDGILQRVHPCLVPLDAPMGRIDGAFNAVQIVGDAVGRVLLEGAGAGGGPTASSVVADIMQIARGHIGAPLTVQSSDLQPLPNAHMAQLEGSYYVRLSVRDEPGVLSDITAIFGDERISVQSFIQHQHSGDSPAQIVITTHVTREASMQNALVRIGALEHVTQTPQMLRIYNG